MCSAGHATRCRYGRAPCPLALSLKPYASQEPPLTCTHTVRSLPSPGRSVIQKQGLYINRISKLRESDPIYGAAHKDVCCRHCAKDGAFGGHPVPQKQELTRLVCFLRCRPSVVSYKSLADVELTVSSLKKLRSKRLRQQRLQACHSSLS